MNIEFKNNNPDLTPNNKILEKYFIECGLFKFKYSYEQRLIDKYLFENFYVRGIFYKSENIENNPTIHRKEKGSKEIYGEQIVIELKKIFGFDIELIELHVKNWFKFEGFDENEIKKLWYEPAIKFNHAIMEDIRQRIFNSCQIPLNLFTIDYPLILVNPDNV